MPRRHTALALVVAVCWAVNFVVVDIGLESFPPLLFAALRFGLTAFPLAAVALGERPNLRQVVGVALAIAGIGAIAAGRAHDVPLPAVAVAGIAGLAYVVIVSTFFGYGHPSRNDSTGGSRLLLAKTPPAPCMNGAPPIASGSALLGSAERYAAALSR